MSLELNVKGCDIMEGEEKSPSLPIKKRFDSIDVMRAMAIIFMVICHAVVYLSPSDNRHPWLYLFANRIIGDFAAPIFVFLVGMSQAVSLSLRADQGGLLNSIGIRMIKRGLIIIAISMVLSPIMYGHARLFDVDILPVIGFALIVFFFMRKAPTTALLFAVFIAVAIAPPLREWSGYAASWGAMKDAPGIRDVLPGFLLEPLSEYKIDFVPAHIIKGFLLNANFPVLPWIAFPIIGYVAGKIGLSGDKIGRFDTKAAVLGIIFIAMGLSAGYYASRNGFNDVISGYIAPLSFYPDSTTLLMVQIGVCLALFSLCRAIFDKAPKYDSFMRYCRLLSKYSLTIYVLQYVFIVWPVFIAGITKGNMLEYYQHAVSVPFALCSSVILLIIFRFIFGWWDKKGGKFSLEWLLAKAVP